MHNTNVRAPRRAHLELLFASGLMLTGSGCVVEPADQPTPGGSALPTPRAEPIRADSRAEPSIPTATPADAAPGLAHDPNSMPEVHVRVNRTQAQGSMNHLPPRFGLGSEVDSERIAEWDIDVMPDGTGLPDGSGSVAQGATIYRQQCESCHGIEARGGRYEALAGREPREGFPFSEDPGLRYTVGNYWPYATTLFDYIRRAMPQAIPGSLSAEQTYSLVAYLLYLNELVARDATLDRESLMQVVMPARDRFVVDDRRGGEELR